MRKSRRLSLTMASSRTNCVGITLRPATASIMTSASSRMEFSNYGNTSRPITSTRPKSAYLILKRPAARTASAATSSTCIPAILATLLGANPRPTSGKSFGSCAHATCHLPCLLDNNMFNSLPFYHYNHITRSHRFIIKRAINNIVWYKSALQFVESRTTGLHEILQYLFNIREADGILAQTALWFNSLHQLDFLISEWLGQFGQPLHYLFSLFHDFDIVLGSL